MSFCPQCGSRIFDEAVICPNCHKSLVAEYTVTVSRLSQVYLYNPPFKLTFDGTVQDELKNGQSKSYTLPAGPHTIFFKGSFRTRELRFILNSNISFLCGWNRATGEIDVFQQ